MPPEYMINTYPTGTPRPRFEVGQRVRKYVQGTTLTPVGTVFTVTRAARTGQRYYYVGAGALAGVWEEELELVSGNVVGTANSSERLPPQPSEALFRIGDKVMKYQHSGARASAMSMNHQFVIASMHNRYDQRWAYYDNLGRGAWEDELIPRRFVGQANA